MSLRDPGYRAKAARINNFHNHLGAMRSKIKLAFEMHTKFIFANAAFASSAVANSAFNVPSRKDFSLCGNLPISRKHLLAPALQKLSVRP